MPAEARAVTASAVISPLNRDRAVTTLSELAAAFAWTAVVALAVVDCAETMEPSEGYANAVAGRRRRVRRRGDRRRGRRRRRPVS